MRPFLRSLFRRVGGILLGIGLVLWVTWAAGALAHDFPVAALRIPATVVFLAATAALAWRCRGSLWRTAAATAACCALVLAWWLTLKPSHDRDWQDDVAQLPWAEVDGDRVTLHNVRHCEYRSTTDYTARWETRTVDLTKLTGLSLAVTYWGSPWMAHPIVSFEFADAPPVSFSIETRKERGERYSAIGGLYRRFELLCIAGDERDLIGVRTNFRQGEDVYLYRTAASPERARERFMEYVGTINRLRDQPRWYNAVTTNCTTEIRNQHPVEERLPWDWRMLVNGLGDELAYERRTIDTSLPFPELKRRSRINDAARAAAIGPDFSQRIRAGLPGFPPAP